MIQRKRLMFMIGFLKLQKKMEKLGEEARIELGDNLYRS